MDRRQSDLLPCPFCGDDGDKGRQRVTQMVDGRPSFDRIICRACGAMCPEPNWNSRTPDAALIAENARLRTDAELLDWLDMMNQALNKRYGTTYGWKVILSPNVVRVMSERRPMDSGYVADVDVADSHAHGCVSVREAIRAALAEHKEPQ